MKKLSWVWLGIFAFALPALAEQRRPATQKEESYMFGRVGGAIEDVGAGESSMKQEYIKEALHKFSSINKDLEKREYSLRTRWLAHLYYGKALLDSGNPQKAISMLEIAETEVKSLTEKEREETSQVLRQARERLTKDRP
jgi:hypothetical protein